VLQLTTTAPSQAPPPRQGPFTVQEPPVTPRPPSSGVKKKAVGAPGLEDPGPPHPAGSLFQAPQPLAPRIDLEPASTVSGWGLWLTFVFCGICLAAAGYFLLPMLMRR
jgi:hypothetical protein